MRNAKALDLTHAVGAVPARTRFRFALLAALACGWLQGCFVFQQPAAPPPTEQVKRAPTAAEKTRTPAVKEDTLPPAREIEGPPLPPAEDEMVGPPAPSSVPAANGEHAASVASEAPVQQAYASPRAEALLAGLARKGLAAQASARGVVMILPESVFEYGTADLPKASKRRLHELAGVILEQASGVPVSVEGHTDSIGAELFNRGLSQRRAKAVADELAAGGIAQGLLRSAGFGAQFPIAPNERPDGSDDPDGRARNRRVEIVIETEAAPRG